ncbi:MAG: ATP-dependent DNA ligase [Polyangiaceae bacterium]
MAKAARTWPTLDLPLTPPFPVMEAKSQPALPSGDRWIFEPKWDGFRCVAFRSGSEVALQSKAGQPLGRYFPDVVAMLGALKAPSFVLDGELVIPAGDAFSFDALLQRMHPAESRVKLLAAQSPCTYLTFDLLVDAKGSRIAELPLHERRVALESFAKKYFEKNEQLRLSPATTDRAVVTAWQEQLHGHGIDGIMAKLADAPYATGDRTGMQKIKWLRAVECVVGGFRYAQGKKEFGSLLLGLYDASGLLNHVGFCSALADHARPALLAKLESLAKTKSKELGFSGSAPGGSSRWSAGRSTEWEPLPPKLVVEVKYDHFSEGRFRHGTTFLRWRPEKDPKSCTTEQLR